MSKQYRALLVGIVVTAISFLLVAVPTLAAAGGNDYQPHDAEDIVFDAVFLRPFGVLATAFGSIVFVASLPFSLPAGNTHEVAQRLIVDPFRYTFSRPLGEVPSYDMQ